MIPGFKTGPSNWKTGRRIVLEDGAQMGEVWFQVDALEEHQYEKEVGWLRERDVTIGLHHWGLCKGSIKPNLATGAAAVREETVQQVKDCIDFAQQYGCAYVNAHPGAQSLERLALDPWQQELIEDSETPKEVAAQNLLASAQELTAYADEREVLLTIETLCGAEQRSFADRSDAYLCGPMDLPVLMRLAESGVALANDMAHTASVAHPLGDGELTPDAMREGLMTFSRQAREATRLLHINTMARPYNGTDSHDGIRDEDFAAGVWPSRDELKEWLRLWRDRNDVYVVLEPREDMQGNFQALVKLLAEL